MYADSNAVPDYVCLNSYSGSTPTNSNSTSTFNMSGQLPCPTDYKIRGVSLLSFSGVNTISNVVTGRNATLKCTAYWVNNISGLTQSLVSTINIPQGQYTPTNLISYLSEYFSLYDGNGNQLTFFSNVVTDSQYDYPGMAINSYTGKMQIQLWPLSLQQSYVTTAGNVHQYSKFELTLDSESKGLMQMLGFACNNETNQPVQASSLVLYCEPYTYDQNLGITTVHYRCYSKTSTVTSYAYETTAENGSVTAYNPSTYFYDFQPTRDLFIEFSMLSSKVRAPYTGYNTSSLACRVPVNTGFGEPITFEQRILQTCYMSNISINTITVGIKDYLGNYVDFQGTNWSMDLRLDYFKEMKDDPENAVKEEKSISKRKFN